MEVFMGIFSRQGWGRALLLMACLVIVAVIPKTAWAETICNACRGTGIILELARPCPDPRHNEFLICSTCGTKGYVGPKCKYCGGTGVILTPAEQEAMRKIQLENEVQAKAQAEQAKVEAEQARLDAEQRRLDWIKKNGQQFTDKRDGKKYLAVRIGNLLWMAENLNYLPQSGNSWCYDNDDSNCNKYGRLYDWKTANEVCPSEYHLPTHQEWERLVTAAIKGKKGEGGKYLKSTSGWSRDLLGFTISTDDFGFSALPGGSRSKRGTFSSVGISGFWWTATVEGGMAKGLIMNADNNRVETDGGYLSAGAGYSVRCVDDRQPAPSNQRSESVDGGTPTNGRTRANINGFITQRMGTLNYIYNARIRQNPRLGSGKITVKFDINEFGNVIYATVVESTIKDSELEKMVVNQVKGWTFGKIDMPGDVTTVDYSFVFEK
jgi:uncharacterized protein (TIGR02145 family)